MWRTEYTAESEMAPTEVWAAFRDIHTGVAVQPGGDRFELDGPFAVGRELSVTPVGQQTFRSRITELVPAERYADETVFGDVVLTFRHTFAAIDGGTRVTHELEIDGPAADELGPELGTGISADFPEAMAGLFELAAASVRAAAGADSSWAALPESASASAPAGR